MAITLVPMQCPNCGATIDAPVSQDECFCTYCGTRILINNENMKTININKTKTKIDLARIAESDRKTLIVKAAAIALGGLIILAIFGNEAAGLILSCVFILVLYLIMFKYGR